MAILGSLLKALLQAVLEFLGGRLERHEADAALRELGARQAEGERQDNRAAMARQAADLRARPVAGDGELDRRLRAPADRDSQRPG